jgi:hypothetical protein
MLELDTNVALALANRRLRERHFLELLLQRGLTAANASTIRFWLESILPHLGMKAVTTLLRNAAIAQPVAVAQAVYFLPGMAKGDSTAMRFVRELQAELKLSSPAAVTAGAPSDEVERGAADAVTGTRK